jgi:hypothetical protein
LQLVACSKRRLFLSCQIADVVEDDDIFNEADSIPQSVPFGNTSSGSHKHGLMSSADAINAIGHDTSVVTMTPTDVAP